MTKFKVGDRVVFASSPFFMVRTGDTGTVVHLDRGALNIGVAWDRNIGGHSCDGRCVPGHGYYVSDCDLRLLNCTCNYEDC